MVATGGSTAIITDGPATYKVHTFTSSGSFVVQALSLESSKNNVQYLVVAGGGSGAVTDNGWGAGGGGAGGFRTNVPGHPKAGGSLAVTAQSYTVTVGAGGAGLDGSQPGNKGSDSVFGSITSTGGGGGLRWATWT